MASYMYNPSQKVTEVLSKYLEFDPGQLELGIWSGDLSLTNVKLRQDAIYPLLNKVANEPHTDPFKKPPLHLKLVSGSIGHMRIRIPWQRLVWGQGDVQVEISDVCVALEFQTKEEREAYTSKTEGGESLPKKDDTKQSSATKSYRDAKQRRLNEAERRLLQGMPIALYLNNIFRKNLIEKEALKVDQAKQHTKSKTTSNEGRVDRWLRNVTSDFFWRFYAGLQGSIKNIGIVVMQDEVEVGCIVQSVDIYAGKEGTEISVNPTKDMSKTNMTGDFGSVERILPKNLVYESAYDDGEHVDKTIRQKGMGIFVRKGVSQAKMPKTPPFSTTIYAEDYILRPVDFDVSFSFFYPFSQERRKKRSADNQSTVTHATVASTDSNTSSKRRRGKRDRAPPLHKELPDVYSYSDMERNIGAESTSEPKRGHLRRTSSARAYGDRISPQVGDLSLRQRPRRILASQTDLGRSGVLPMPQLNRVTSGNTIISGMSVGTSSNEIRSILEPPSLVSERPSQPVPHFECRIDLHEIRVVFSNRHFELLNYFVSVMHRVQNGRPEMTIRSVREGTGRNIRSNYKESITQPRLHVDTVNASPRSVVVKKWWNYAISATLWEIRNKRDRKKIFLDMYVSFDWDRQRYMRQEYVDLYIAKLENKQNTWLNDDEEKLLRIEDELPIEQILLYRSISRSLWAKRKSKMPATILETYDVAPSPIDIYKKEAKNARIRQNQVTDGSTLISLLQNKYDLTRKTRLKDDNASKRKQLSIYDGEPGDIVSLETQQDPSPSISRKSASEFDEQINSDLGNTTPPRTSESNRNMAKDFQVGNFYSSGIKKDSRAGFRNIATRGNASVDPSQSHVDCDNRMRISVSLQIQSIDLVLYEIEDFIFDLPSDNVKSKLDGFNNNEDTSSEQLSDLSVLTDDQHFFDDGSINTIAEQKEEVETQKPSSMDYLQFDQPENIILRLTLASMASKLRGVSGGPYQIGLFLGSICIVGEDKEEILSICSAPSSAPMSEVSIGSRDMQGGERRERGPRAKASERAVTLNMNRDNGANTVQCDVAKITVIATLSPLAKVLAFCEKSKIKHPNPIVAKSSRDVARELMVKKIAASSKLGDNINAAIRLHGFEMSVPFLSHETEVSEASDVFSSSSSGGSIPTEQKKAQSKTCKAIFSAETLELYSGRVVDEICVVAQEEESGRNISLSTTFFNKTATLKNIEMLEINRLTSMHDSFASCHWVAIVAGVDCILSSGEERTYGLTRTPFDLELLFTVTGMSLLESESPKYKAVLEISPIHLLLSSLRLDLVSKAMSSIDLSPLASASRLMKQEKPDPPRIEILASRILHSLDLSCSRLHIDLVRDSMTPQGLSYESKELIMEECLSDFLSILACFDFALPNEEALASAMQVCIGRLVGLGLTDDEAWGCTNAARLNFLDDVANFRQAQNDALVRHRKFSRSLSEEFNLGSDGPTYDNSSSDIEDNEEDEQSLATDDADLDGDSADSADIVETTLNNAVEKTVAAFSPLLQECHTFTNLTNSVISIELPFGVRLSLVKLFYDQHLSFHIPSLVITNAAGIELLTLVPSMDKELPGEKESSGECIHFSRFDLDKSYGFGCGGLPMTVLGSDEGADRDTDFRRRARFDDFDIGELEVLFASVVIEEVIDEVSKYKKKKKRPRADIMFEDGDNRNGQQNVAAISTVLIGSSLSILCSDDQLVPFSRFTFENMCYKNTEALEASANSADAPSWSIGAKSLKIQNLTPEGQLYPDIIYPVSDRDGGEENTFELRYFKSSHQRLSYRRLEIDLISFRLILLRQFLSELVNFLGDEAYGFGRLATKYADENSEDLEVPLLFSIKMSQCSLVCPRCSSSSDMAAFEVSEGVIRNYYVRETFAMPTESSAFDISPQGDILFENVKRPMDESFLDEGATSDLVKRLVVTLNEVELFTALSEEKTKMDVIESAAFRFIHELNGRAEEGKLVYQRKKSIQEDILVQVDSCDLCWERISSNSFDLEVLCDYAPHMRLLISNQDSPLPLSLDARLSQLCLLLSIWDSNMQEMPTMFPFSVSEVKKYATPPEIPSSFPSYGTDEFVSYLERISLVSSEICCIFNTVTLRCTFDRPNQFPADPYCFRYFEDANCTAEERPGLVLTLRDAVVHVVNDAMNTKRVAVGSSSLHLLDQRRPLPFQNVLKVGAVDSNETSKQRHSWAPLNWGLREDVHTLSSELPVPVLFTVFMTPGWSLINTGFQDANGVMHDLSWLWILLEYFKSYYTDMMFGNPAYQALRWVHKVKNALRRTEGEEPQSYSEDPGRNIDFRLWLCRPILCLPSDYEDVQAPCVCIHSKSGLWYRYNGLLDFSSQEVATTDINLVFANEFQSPHTFRQNGTREAVSTQLLVDGLSFGLRYDCNYGGSNYHTDCSLLIPYAEDGTPSLAVAGQELEVDPVILECPTVCTPSNAKERVLGTNVCELTCIIDVIPTTTATMMNFFQGPSKVNEDFVIMEDDLGPATFSITASVRDMRVFAIDPVLGAQLPVAVLSMSSISFAVSKYSIEESDLVDPIQSGANESPPEDFHFILDCCFWADYFKLGLTRSWEPLLEPFQLLLLNERSKERGFGVNLDTDTPFHLNLSGALLEVLSDTVDSFLNQFRETFGNAKASQKSLSMLPPSKITDSATIQDSFLLRDGKSVPIIHEKPKALKREDRVAFSLSNMTGQKIRIHQQAGVSVHHRLDQPEPAIITYLNQRELVGLTFAPTISIIKNLSIEEVAYPGFQNSRSDDHNQGSLHQSIDLQVPGFRWLQGIQIDTFGRKFQSLEPRSSSVQSKISRDWRLRNAMMLLSEVGLDNGGRLVTFRSLFEIRNNTKHPIKLCFNPNPRYKPIEVTLEKFESMQNSDHGSRLSFGNEDIVTEEDTQVISPGDICPIPILLLERALQMTGSHLGCLWLCPDASDGDASYSEFARKSETKEKDNEIKYSFCSRPIQLAKLVHESSLMFKKVSGQELAGDDAKTGVQVSCSTKTSCGKVRAPFCYAIEVSRSPLVKISEDRSSADVDVSLSTETERRNVNLFDKKSKKEAAIHAPVAYSLSIHPPIVVVNLLPEGGRFEIMHAVRKTVLWFADLEPGQQVAVHSVGLDAPLLLLINLGYCRTPVGEGALVHFPANDSTAGGGKDQGVRLKGIGKVAIKGTKQIGKTLTAISDSPDKRVQRKVNEAQYNQREKRKRKTKRRRSITVSDESLGFDDAGVEGMSSADGKVHSVESVMLSSSDIASSTTVVDSIGQKLTLKIDNVQGGGGQRRISIFCPFWIVNNTEHSLVYRQDKAKSFVCGTVVSPEEDGSRPVDGSNRNYRNLHKLQTARQNLMNQDTSNYDGPMNAMTIFAGTPGSLATYPGRCDMQPAELAAMIEKHPTTQKLADLAFMFNFNDEGLTIGQQMLSVRLQNGRNQSKYTSDWSRGFSLESVGYYQIVGMHCKDGRSLELSLSVEVGPGSLSQYTKIIRFLPRYVIFNRLDRPIRLWQDSSIFRPVNEDRAAAATDTLKSSKIGRKWRYDFEVKHRLDKINQYESLFGRPSTVDDTRGNRTAQMMGNAIILEGTTAHRSALYIASVGPSELVPFLLPDSRAERQFRVDLGGIYNVTSSFASELPGEHNLNITKATDLSLLKHVSSRAAPKYKIVLPPPEDAFIGDWDGELGLFFETDRGGDKAIVVKGKKRGKYAFNHTDIHVGDELLRVDGVSVWKMPFQDTMKLIKERLAYVSMVRREQQNAPKQPRRGLKRLSLANSNRRLTASFSKQSNYEEEKLAQPVQLTLTFRTFEERLRKLRSKAGNGEGNLNLNLAQRRASGDAIDHDPLDGISVEMKSWHNTMFVVIKEQDRTNPMFRISNQSINHIVFYRQRGCDGHPWNHLIPGQSKIYSWEEPMKSKKLSVRVAAKAQDIFKLDDMAGSHSEKFSDVDSATFDREADPAAPIDQDKPGVGASRLRQAFSQQYVYNEERGGYGPSISVRLEEIGYRSLLPVQSKEIGKARQYLSCEVDTDGLTRQLIVSDDSGTLDERHVLNRHLDTLKKQELHEQERITALNSLKFGLSQLNTDDQQDNANATDSRVVTIESDAMRLIDDFPEESTISGKHQVVVEISEAMGLNVSDFVSNPYCEVFLKGRSKSRKYFFQKRRNKRKTYFIEKALNPKWTDQIFVFDVPPEAASVIRGYTLQIKVRNFRLVGAHPIIGQATVHFESLRMQQEVVGWYPLSGRAGRRYGENLQVADSSRGSIKLRAQWIYNSSALLDYFLLISERRMEQLVRSREGMTNQLVHAIESEKRRREALDQLDSGRIQDLVKLQRKKKVQRKKRLGARGEAEREMVAEKMNHALKESLKTSRDRYLYAMYFQTVESKRNRLLSKDNIGEQTAGSIASKLSFDSDGKSSQSLVSQSLENFFLQNPRDSNANKRLHRYSPEKFQNRRRALSDFFKEQGQTHRKLSSGIEENVPEENSIDLEEMEQWDSSIRHGQAIYDVLYEQRSEVGFSDLMLTNAGVDEESRHEHLVRRLLIQGFLFHPIGNFFHQDHLPAHFQKSHFSSSRDTRNSRRLYRPRFAVGTSITHIKHFRSWQSAYALYYDPEVRISLKEETFIPEIKESAPKPTKAKSNMSKTKLVVKEKLYPPEDAPRTTLERIGGRIDKMYTSRLKFDRACKRILGSVLNPGGWLTIRPITVLNLDDNYNGMFVKLRYGSEVLETEIVDARVTPRWSTLDVFGGEASEMPTGGTMSSSSQNSGARENFRFGNNDLHVRVEPQQTSGSIKISIYAERLKSKIELGVLQLPLGAAIAACIDSSEEMLDAGRLPMYVRWFPLMDPKLTEPVVGDMGLSFRPKESEKLRDNMFEQYFTPCIQLALIWWPDSNETQLNGLDGQASSIPMSTSNAAASGRAQSKLLIENYFNADISRISAALIDSERALELLSLTATDIDVRYSSTRRKTRLGVVVGSVQIDHQGPSREPVVLAPTPTLTLQPTLQFLALRDNLKTKNNVVSFEYIGVYIQEMDLTVEESLLFELWNFWDFVVRRSQVKRETRKGRKAVDAMSRVENCFVSNDTANVVVPSLLSILQGTGSEGSSNSKRKFYIEQLILGLVKINLSYIKGKKHSWDMSDQRVLARKNLDAKDLPNLTSTSRNKENKNNRAKSDLFRRWSQHTSDEDFITETGGDASFHLPGIIAAVFPSVSDASIRLQGKAIEHVFESPDEIFSSIKNFYVNETLSQVYKLIGSLDFVGNPTTIISSFMSGVRDLVIEPTKATNVNQVGIGVAKGTISLFSHSTSGIFGFLAKMSASAGQTVAAFSLDSEFRQNHRDTVVAEATGLNRVWKRRGVQNVSEILLRPIGDIILGVAMGASGLILSPYKGLKRHGKWGFVQGVATGTAGLVTKPIVGVLDAFTHFSSTVHDIARSANVLDRRFQPSLKLRLPVTFGPMKILSPFDAVTARSMELLKTFPPKVKKVKIQGDQTAEFHVHSEVLHMEAGVETYAIVSTIRVVLIKLKKDNHRLSPSFEWEVILTGDMLVTSRLSDYGHNGVALTLTKRADNKEVIETLKDDKSSVTNLQMKQLPSSAFSVDSEPSNDEAQAADLAAQEDLNYKDISSKTGGQILEWFTVQAEFQHRLQLTRLHNAICCVVGDFSSVIVDHTLDSDQRFKEATTFGLFNFGLVPAYPKTSLASNEDLVSALEHLAWMHDSTFRMIRGVPTSLQTKEVSRLRQQWTYSKEMQASLSQGGAKWLVEARARAMFVPLKLPKFVDRNNPSIERVSHELEQGNLSSEQASKILELASDANSVLSDYEDLDENIEVFASHYTGLKTRPSVVEFQSPPSSEKDLAKMSSWRAQRATLDESFHSANVKEIPSDSSQAQNRTSNIKYPNSAGETLTNARIDRMETLIDQLIRLNAQQSPRQQPIASDFSGDSPSSKHESRIAETVIQELAELRSQVERRALEDEKLRDEIAMLRQQLADGRETRETPQRNQKEEPRKSDETIGKEPDAMVSKEPFDANQLAKEDSTFLGSKKVETETEAPYQSKDRSLEYSGGDDLAARRRSNSTDSSLRKTRVVIRRSSGESVCSNEAPRHAIGSIDGSMGSMGWSSDDGFEPLKMSTSSRRNSASSMESDEKSVNELKIETKKERKRKTLFRFGRKKKKKESGS